MLASVLKGMPNTSLMLTQKCFFWALTNLFTPIKKRRVGDYQIPDMEVNRKNQLRRTVIQTDKEMHVRSLPNASKILHGLELAAIDPPSSASQASPVPFQLFLKGLTDALSRREKNALKAKQVKHVPWCLGVPQLCVLIKLLWFCVPKF